MIFYQKKKFLKSYRQIAGISQAIGELKGFKERVDYMFLLQRKNYQTLMLLKT